MIQKQIINPRWKKKVLFLWNPNDPKTDNRPPWRKNVLFSFIPRARKMWRLNVCEGTWRWCVALKALAGQSPNSLVLDLCTIPGNFQCLVATLFACPHLLQPYSLYLCADQGFLILENKIKYF
jgi:hypothetical protein